MPQRYTSAPSRQKAAPKTAPAYTLVIGVNRQKQHMLRHKVFRAIASDQTREEVVASTRRGYHLPLPRSMSNV
eukprot:5779996-Prymnesium_polylepis.1